MRIMMIVRMPHPKFNAAVGDGSVESKMKTILEETKPEAIYFTEFEGLGQADLDKIGARWA